VPQSSGEDLVAIRFITRWRNWWNRRKRPYFAFQIEPTSRCQLRCAICPRSILSSQWQSRDLPFSVFEKIIPWLKNARHVHLQGWGEPLLHSRIVAMLHAVKRAGCKASITTNGLALTPALSERLIAEGLDTITISLAGGSPATHRRLRSGSDLSAILKNIEALADHKERYRLRQPALYVSYLMTKPSLPELKDFLPTLHHSGVQKVIAANLEYTPTAEQDALKIFGWKKDEAVQECLSETAEAAQSLKLPVTIYPAILEETVVCELDPRRILFITADGSVSPCIYLKLPVTGPIPRYFDGSDYRVPQLSFGSLAHQEFLAFRHNPHYLSFCNELTARSQGVSELYDDLAFSQVGSLEKIRAMEKESREVMRRFPLPQPCRTCYKAYGI